MPRVGHDIAVTDEDVLVPKWGPRVQELKNKLRDVEEEEQTQSRDFILDEEHRSEEMERLEEEYTQGMERIRERDLGAKEDLHRKYQRLRLRSEEQRRRTHEEREDTMDRVLRRRETELKRKLEKAEESLLAQYRGLEQALEKEVSDTQAELSNFAEDSSRANLLGLDVVNAPSRGTGARVLRSMGLAAQAGIRNGDIITNLTTALDTKTKDDVAHLLETARPKEQMHISLLRGDRERELILTAGGRPRGQRRVAHDY